MVGVSLRKPQALAGVLGVVRSFSGATAPGMRARSCRIGPAIPVEGSTQHAACRLYVDQGSFTN
jgi:hypothetical protein